MASLVGTYAIEIKNQDLALLMLLNGGKAVEVKRKTWLVFSVSDDGSEVTSKVVTHNELISDYDIGSRSPFILRLKTS